MLSCKFRPRLSGIAHGLVTCVSILAISVQPILAQGLEPTNGAPGNLNVTTAPNDVPLVNIATPNGQGLSHNQYDQFNVDTNGVILNNETGTFGETQLGGVTPGNANLANSGAARVILNEVVSANPSSLGGVTEVAGQAADVIVANPNGISCSGCGFIRTPRVVLTTGTPDIVGGDLQGFTVDGGSITFGADGADLSEVNLFDIISRQVNFEGAVAGQDVRVTAGRNSFAYASGEVTALADDGSTSPAFGIDSTAVGGLYAGRITLLSTESGVAVRAPQEMAASSGGMVLTADGRLVIGQAQATGAATVRSNSAPVVVETSLFSEDAVSLTGVSAEVADGAILASAADLTVTADTVTLGSGALAAAGMDSKGNLGATGDLAITADTLAATGAELAAAGDAALSADAITLNQTGDAEAVSVLGNLTVETAALSATNATIDVGDNLSVSSADALTVTGGNYVAGGDVDVEAASATSGASFEATGNASLTALSGDLNTSGDIDAGGALALTSAGDLTTSGALTASTTGTLSATGDLTNSGSVVTAGALTATGANVFNSGPFGSSDGDVSLTTPGNITNTGVVYGGGDITLSLDGVLLNDTSDIIAEGGISIGGESGASATSVLNRSANIEAITGSILIAAALVENSQPAPTLVPEVEVTSVEGTAADFPDVSHPSRTYRVVQTTTVTTMVVDSATDAPARILAGADLTIDANTITNEYSQITANEDVTLKADTVTNSGQDLIQTTVVSTESFYSERYCDIRIFGFCLDYDTRYLTRTDTDTSTATEGALFATIQAGGTLDATISGYLGNEAVRGEATQIGLSSDGRALAAPPLIGAINPNAILDRSALFTPSNEPNGPFLVETRTEFIDVSGFLSSDYFLDLIGGYDADITQRRFGDAYVEARLIQEQLFALTGQRAAEDPDALRALMQQLYDNAFDAADALELTPGVSLSAEQVAALTDTIIWLEEQTIDGQVVLVPVVYLGPDAADEVSLASAQIVAATVDIDAGNALNSGRIAGEDSVDIATTGDLLNIGGQIASDGDVDLDVEGRLANVSGQITGDDIGIDAAELENSTALIRDENPFGYSDRAQATGEMAARGNLQITVTGDITSVGGQFTAGEDATLNAEGDVVLEALVLDTVREQEFDEGYDNSFTREAELAAVRAGNALNVNVGGDLIIAGAEIDAGGDAALNATGDIDISSVQEIQQEDYRFDIDSGSFLGVETNIRRQDQETTTEQTTIDAGGNLIVSSGEGNVTLEAPALASRGETVISAENGQVSILTTEDSAFTRDERREEDLFWWNSEDTGSSEVSRTFTTIEAGGGLQIVSGGEIIVEYTATGDFSEGVAQLAAAPGLEWMGDLETMDNVAWQLAETAFEEWNYEDQGLTEAGALLVTAVASYATSGLTAGWASGIAEGIGLASGGVGELAIQTGLRSLVNQAAVSAANNQGDLGAVLQELGSGDSVRGLVTAMVSAGLGAHVVAELGFAGDLPATGSLVDRALYDLQADLVQASVTASVEVAINGGDLGDALFDGWTNAMVMSGLSVVQNEIGTLTADAGLEEGSVPHLVAHAVAGGLAAEALGQDFADGAASAAVAVLAGSVIGDRDLPADMQSQLVSLVSTTAVLIVTDGDVGSAALAGAIASSLDLNNRQLHTREIQALEEYAASLNGVDGLSADEWLQALTLQAMRSVDDRAARQIAFNAEAQGHLDILIAQHGETFTNGLGGLMGFLNETNPELYDNGLANIDHVVANREFYDTALQDWTPPTYESLQGYVSATDLVLLNSVYFHPRTTVERLVPEDLSDLPEDARRAAGTLQIMGLLHEFADVHARLIAARDAVNDTGTTESIVMLEDAINVAETGINNGSFVIYSQLQTGMLRGATDEVVSGFASMLSLAADQASVLVGTGDLTGATERNVDRYEAFVDLLENFDELPDTIQQGLASRATEMDRAISEGRLEDAGEILGEFNVYAASAATGTVGLTAGTATLLRRVGGNLDVRGNGTASGSSDLVRDLDATNNVDDVIRVPNGPDYTPTTIGGRQYSSHALQRMNERGLTPSVVENTVDDAFLVGQGNRPNTIVYYDPTNRVQVVTNFTGDVVTVIPGNAPKPGALAPLGD